MKLVAEVRSIERRVYDQNGSASVGPEKRAFKLNVRPATKSDSYFGYGSMNFVLNGREMEDFGADLGAKLDLYLVSPDAAKPEVAALDDLRRELYECEAKLKTALAGKEQAEGRNREYERTRWDASEKMKALQSENVRLTVELMTLRGAAGTYQPVPQMIDSTPRSSAE